MMFGPIDRLCVCLISALELRSLDKSQRWNLDNPTKVAMYYANLDRFVEELHSNCHEFGVTLMLLSGHRMEPFTGRIDLIGRVRTLDISRDEYIFFVEAPKARFSFYTERVRKTIVPMLSALANASLLSYRDMHQYTIEFDDDRYGEFYFQMSGHPQRHA